MRVTVEGAGRLIGLDNGDSTDYDAYKGTVRKLFQGKLLAMIAAKNDPRRDSCDRGGRMDSHC